MSPTFSHTGNINWHISDLIYQGNQKYKLGYGFDSSTDFELSNKAIRSPDCSWIKKERWESLSDTEKNNYAPICPDFIVEIRSNSNTLNALKTKMLEWL